MTHMPGGADTDLLSPNFGARRGTARPDMVVLHYTGMTSAKDALERLRDPASKVSCHYLIDLDGARAKLVRPRHRAWHAGVSSWGGVRDVNSHSIGIELVNPGAEPDCHPFPEPQTTRLEALLAHLIRRFSIRPERVVGHACIAPGRKIDPGPKFDWRRLALQGLSVWLDPEPAETRTEATPNGADPSRFQRAARRFGYPVPASGAWCAGTRSVWEAYRMRFYPQFANVRPFAGGVRRLERLAERWPARL